MFAAHVTAQEIVHARAVLMIIAIGIVVFWRVAIRILIAAIVVAVGAGALLLLQSMHR